MEWDFFKARGRGEEKHNGKLILGLIILAFALRVPLLLFPEVIHNDATEYIRHAKQIFLGNWSAGKAPPLYPFLIALAQVFTNNYEMAGIWISAILGTLLVVPVFYLGRSIFSEEAGILSALIAAVHPLLNIASGSVLTESTYYFLLTMAVFFGWRAFEKGRFPDTLLFSLFTSLAYLTRPEAIGFLFVFSVWVLSVSPADEKRPWLKRIGMVFLACLLFLLFSSPYLVQIRKETGQWGITKKFIISVDSVSQEKGESAIESITRKKEINLRSFPREPLTVSKKIVLGSFNSLYKFQQGYTPLLFFLGAFGFIKTVSCWRGNLYLMAYLFFFLALIFPFFWVTRRYTSQMIPIALPWAAAGFLFIGNRVDQRIRGPFWKRKVPAMLLVFLLVGLFLQGRIIHGREHRFIQREAGLWMRDHLPRGSKVMSNLPQEAFYAELPWTRMRSGSYELIMEAARKKGVRYLVVDEAIEKDSPGFPENLKKGELVPVFDLKRKNQRVTVFEIIDCRGK